MSGHEARRAEVEPYAVVPRPRWEGRAGGGVGVGASPEDVLDRLAMRDWTRIGDGALIRDAMDVSLAAGVRQRPVNVAAGRSVAVWEMDMIIPTDDPEHWPAALAWIMSLDGGRVSQLRLVHPVPLDGPATPDLYALTQKAPGA
ncbi:hypothetical protein ABH920_009478 [Catenulispora sp. EB89]|uniref:hypothetical protein n=1 Tax=Catenulispora sp. EB89 TaxID=3156257 RepID=UPI0035143E68